MGQIDYCTAATAEAFSIVSTRPATPAHFLVADLLFGQVAPATVGWWGNL
jgi:hypothetical protein